MSEVKRYHSAYPGSMYETIGSDFCEGVDFVCVSDYDSLAASHARLVEALEEIGRVHKCTDGQFRVHAQGIARAALADAKKVQEAKHGNAI